MPGEGGGVRVRGAAAVAAPSRLPGSRAVRERAAAIASHLSEGEAGKGSLVGGVEAIDLKTKNRQRKPLSGSEGGSALRGGSGRRAPGTLPYPLVTGAGQPEVF